MNQFKHTRRQPVLAIGLVMLAMLVLVTACGRGGGGESPDRPANTAPPSSGQSGGSTANPDAAIEEILSGLGQIGSEELAPVDEGIRKEIDSLSDSISGALDGAADVGAGMGEAMSGDSVTSAIDDILAGFDRIGTEELDPVNNQLQDEINSLDSNITGALDDASGGT